MWASQAVVAGLGGRTAITGFHEDAWRPHSDVMGCCSICCCERQLQPSTPATHCVARIGDLTGRVDSRLLVNLNNDRRLDRIAHDGVGVGRLAVARKPDAREQVHGVFVAALDELPGDVGGCSRIGAQFIDPNIAEALSAAEAPVEDFVAQRSWRRPGCFSSGSRSAVC